MKGASAMKRSVKESLVVCGLTAVMAIGLATPANAVTINLGGCSADGQSPVGAARVSNISCERVQARVQYRDTGGTLRYAYGLPGSNSTATALTSMLVGRAGQGYRNGGWSGYIGY